MHGVGAVFGMDGDGLIACDKTDNFFTWQRIAATSDTSFDAGHLLNNNIGFFLWLFATLDEG